MFVGQLHVHVQKQKIYLLTSNSSFFWAGRAFFCAMTKVESKPGPLSSTERLSEEYEKNGTRVVVHPKTFSVSALTGFYRWLQEVCCRAWLGRFSGTEACGLLIVPVIKAATRKRCFWDLVCLGFLQFFFILQQTCRYLGLIKGWSEGSHEAQLI